jgi:hypothetical protein
MPVVSICLARQDGNLPIFLASEPPCLCLAPGKGREFERAPRA